jgi:hypothetical protein
VANLPTTYFERHKYRVASGRGDIGKEIWEANGFGKKSTVAAPENVAGVEVDDQEDDG